MQIQNGGNLTSAVGTLANMLAPMGKNDLSTLIVLLALHALGKKKTSKSNQKGGMFHDYLKIFYPMGKNELC